MSLGKVGCRLQEWEKGWSILVVETEMNKEWSLQCEYVDIFVIDTTLTAEGRSPNHLGKSSWYARDYRIVTGFHSFSLWVKQKRGRNQAAGFTNPQNSWDWKGPLSVILSNPLAQEHRPMFRWVFNIFKGKNCLGMVKWGQGSLHWEQTHEFLPISVLVLDLTNH